jgi:glycosyltransferase involved in cell wall biosynthesis
MKPKHSVIIITYNQQELIGRALESVLCQKEFLHEIVISDDCSTDRNWDVIRDYECKYPYLIKAYRHPVNLGIFGNIESTWIKPTGDLIWYLSGDDEFCNGLFEEANKLIESRKVDFINDAVTLYFDYKAITPDGKESIFRNKLIEQYNPFSLKIRQLISNRTTGLSIKVLEQFYPVRKDIGIYADSLIDIQTQIFSKKNYYCPFVASIYYTSIGISSITKNDLLTKSAIQTLEQIKSDFKNISQSDKYWLNYKQTQHLFSYSPSFKNYLTYLKLFLVVINSYFGWPFIIREIKCITKVTVSLISCKNGFKQRRSENGK